MGESGHQSHHPKNNFSSNRRRSIRRGRVQSFRLTPLLDVFKTFRSKRKLVQSAQLLMISGVPLADPVAVLCLQTSNIVGIERASWQSPGPRLRWQYTCGAVGEQHFLAGSFYPSVPIGEHLGIAREP